jgi:CRP-like cAMP-binding protein
MSGFWLAEEGGLARAARYFPAPRPELSQILATGDALLHREMHRNPCYFRRGHVLVRAGEPMDTVYRLLTGSVARVRYMPDGRRQIISFSTPGDLLPARAVLLGNLPDFSIVLANSAMESLDCRAAIKLATEHPEVAFRLMWQISEDERRLRNNLMMLAKGSAKERVAAMIADIHGRLTLAAGPQERHKIISLRQQDIADYLGLTLVHVNRVLRSLREEGVIEVATGAIGVRDLSRIVEYATPMLDIDELATPEFVSGAPG